MIASVQQFKFLQSVVESLSREQNDLSLDATLFGSNGVPLQCSQLALGAMSPFLCALLKESGEVGEDQSLILPDIEHSDLESLCKVLTFTPGAALVPTQLHKLQHLQIHFRWEEWSDNDKGAVNKLEESKLNIVEDYSQLEPDSFDPSLHMQQEESPPEDYQTEEVPQAFHGPHSSVFSKQPPTTTLGLPAAFESPSGHKSDLQPNLNLESLTQIKLPSKIESESNQDIPINLSQSNERSMQRFKVKDQNSQPRRGVKRKSRSHSSKKRSDIKIELGTKTGCSLCQKPLQPGEQMIFHLKTEHQVRPFKCSYCRQAFLHESELENHKAVHALSEQKLFPCDQCEKKYQSLPSLQQHKRDTHAGLKFTCDICNRDFKCNRYLQEHKLKRHTNQTKVECPICQKSFSSKSELVTHTTIHTAERPFQCNSCKQSFRTKNVLNTHIMKHTGVRNKICDLCGQQFLHQSDLTKHMRTHTGAKPFSCNLCDSNFARKDYLSKHMKSHSTKESKVEKLKERRAHRSSKASYTPPLLLDSLVPMELEVGSPGSLQVVSILNDTTQNLVIDGLDDAEELVETEQMIHDQGDKLNSQTGDLEAIPEPEQNIVLCKLDNNSIRAPKNDPFLS